MDMEQENKNNDSDTGVQFKEYRAPRSYSSSETPKIIQWVIKYSAGLVKNKKQANYVLLGFVVVAIIVSLFLIFGGGGSNIPKEALENPEYGLPEVD